MQRHTLLFNTNFKSITKVVNSDLQNINLYEVNNVQGLGGGIVNASNVRVFLNDEFNEDIINDFFSYLTGATTTIEFSSIYNSDQKLSDVFNNYYNSAVLSNQLPPTSVIDASLSATTGTTIIQNTLFDYNGVAPSKYLEGVPQSLNDSTRQLYIYSAITTYTLEESYYIPVFIKRNFSQMDREKINFDEIQASDTTGTTNTKIEIILQGFVNINLETNENIGTTITPNIVPLPDFNIGPLNDFRIL